MGNRGHAEIVGDGESRAFTIRHRLGTTDPAVQVWELENPPDLHPARLAYAEPDIEVLDGDSFILKFDVPPQPGSHRVVVIHGDDHKFQTMVAFWDHEAPDDRGSP